MRERQPKTWVRVVSALAGAAAGITIFVWLVAGGVPQASVEFERSTTFSESRQSGCPKTCDEPQTTKSRVSVKTELPSGEAGQNALEKAFDNDAGIFLLRLIAALVVALLTAIATQRILNDLFGDLGGHAGTPAPTGESPKPSAGAPAKSPRRKPKQPAPEPPAAERHEESGGELASA